MRLVGVQQYRIAVTDNGNTDDLTEYHKILSSGFCGLLAFSVAKFMTAFACYFDETGTHENAEYTFVCGFVANKKQWARFDRGWRRVLNRFHVDVFHANEFYCWRCRNDEPCKMHEVNKFNGWSNEKRGKFILALVDEIAGRSELIIAHGVIPEQFREAKATLDVRLNLTDYQLCAEQCMTALSKWAMASPYRGPIDVIYDRGNKLMGETMRVYDDATRCEEMRKKYRISHITRGNTVDDTPIQAADLLAYETQWYHKNKINSPELAVRAPLQKLLASGVRQIGHLNNVETIKMQIDVILQNRSFLEILSRGGGA